MLSTSKEKKKNDRGTANEASIIQVSAVDTASGRFETLCRGRQRNLGIASATVMIRVTGGANKSKSGGNRVVLKTGSETTRMAFSMLHTIYDNSIILFIEEQKVCHNLRRFLLSPRISSKNLLINWGTKGLNLLLSQNCTKIIQFIYIIR